MDEHSNIYIGLDVAKARHAVAMADGGQQGEVRYLGEIDADPASVRQWSPGSRSGIGYCTSVKRRGRPGAGFTGRLSRWGIAARWSRRRLFNQAYNGRRKRVLDGKTPNRVVAECLEARLRRANPAPHGQVSSYYAIKACLIAKAAKEVSQPDS